jgi:hypothetical protein
LFLIRLSGQWLKKLHLYLLPRISSSSFNKGFDQLLIFYGFLVFGLAITSYILGIKKTTLTKQFLIYVRSIYLHIREKYNQNPFPFKITDSHIVWLLLFLIIAISLRSFFLNQPIREDEATTFLRYANGNIFQLFNYSAPNNHVLNSILIKLATHLWIPSPSTIRIPAYLGGIASIIIAFDLSRTLINKKSGIFITFSMSVFPLLVFYSTNGRGYSILIAFTLLAIYFGMKYINHSTLTNRILLAFVSALGLFTIPIMLFPIVGIYFWILCLLLIMTKVNLYNAIFKHLFPIGFLTFCFTLILYTPVIFYSNGIESIIANRYVQPQSWQVFIAKIIPHFRNTFTQFSGNIPLVFLIISLILIIIGFFSSVRNRNWLTLLILPSMTICSLILLFIQHTIPYPRTWIFLVPIFLLMADAGFAYIYIKLPQKYQAFINFSLLSIAIIFAVSLISKNTISFYKDTGYFPEASTIALYLKPFATNKDVLTVAVPANSPMDYYLWLYDIPAMDNNIPNPNNIYFVVKKSVYSITDLTDKPVIELLDFGDAVLYKAYNFDHK